MCNIYIKLYALSLGEFTNRDVSEGNPSHTVFFTVSYNDTQAKISSADAGMILF